MYFAQTPRIFFCFADAGETASASASTKKTSYPNGKWALIAFVISWELLCYFLHMVRDRSVSSAARRVSVMSVRCAHMDYPYADNFAHFSASFHWKSSAKLRKFTPLAELWPVHTYAALGCAALCSAALRWTITSCNFSVAALRCAACFQSDKFMNICYYYCSTLQQKSEPCCRRETARCRCKFQALRSVQY